MIELGPSILILDDIDELFESGNNLNYAGGCYIVHLLIEIFAEFNEKQSSKNSIFLIGITSRLSLIDSVLLSSAVFCSRFEVNLPNLQDRKILLKKLLEYKAECSDDHLETYIEKIAVASQGFSCSDIVNILRSAILKQKTNDLTLEAVLEAAKKVKPANLAGIVSQIPKVYFKDLYGMDEVIGKLKV
jgi:SpoVK/Ycf46/Vps4 family AAA+-type ATPase